LCKSAPTDGFASRAKFNGRARRLASTEIRTDGGLASRGSHFETAFADCLAWRDFGFPDAAGFEREESEAPWRGVFAGFGGEVGLGWCISKPSVVRDGKSNSLGRDFRRAYAATTDAIWEREMADGFDLKKYLARVGFPGAARPDLATLSALHSAHVDAIPFEGMDPLLGRPVKLDLPSLQAKLIDSPRGGYCFEQNALFKAALDEIGFKVTGLGGRVRWMSPPDAPLGPREHMLLKVDLPEGSYLADVGFGACVLDRPLRFGADGEQSTSMGTFLLKQADGMFTLSAKQPNGYRDMYVFDLQPQIAADYELGNWYTSTNPRAPFPHVLIMERVGSDKRYKLINRRYAIESRDGEATQETLMENAEELGRVLDEVFGVIPPVPNRELFDRLNG
jgi:N-hydroxyarylamine O-acetyltransferase